MIIDTHPVIRAPVAYHVRFNVTDEQSLYAAIERPEEYRVLCVRAAGYILCFVEFDPARQEEIIHRGETDKRRRRELHVSAKLRNPEEEQKKQHH